MIVLRPEYPRSLETFLPPFAIGYLVSVLGCTFCCWALGGNRFCSTGIFLVYFFFPLHGLASPCSVFPMISRGHYVVLAWASLVMILLAYGLELTFCAVCLNNDYNTQGFSWACMEIFWFGVILG